MTAPLSCITCSYSLAGLDDSGACPECATPIAHTIAVRATRFPSPQRLPAARRAVRMLFLSSVGAPIVLTIGMVSFFSSYTLGPLPIILWSLIAFWILWQGGWLLLARHDPTRRADMRPPRSTVIVIACVVLSILATLIALLAATPLMPSMFAPGAGGIYWAFAYQAVFLLVPPLILTQVIAGAAILSRITSDAHRESRKDGNCHWLRVSAASTLGAYLISAGVSYFGLPAPMPNSAAHFVLTGLLVVVFLIGALLTIIQLASLLAFANADLSRTLRGHAKDAAPQHTQPASK